MGHAGHRGAERTAGNQAIERVILESGATHPYGELSAIAPALCDPGGPERARSPQRGRLSGAIGSLEQRRGVTLAEPQGRQATNELRVGVGRPRPGGCDRCGIAVLHEQRSRAGHGAACRPRGRRQWVCCLGGRCQALQQAANGRRLRFIAEPDEPRRKFGRGGAAAQVAVRQNGPKQQIIL